MDQSRLSFEVPRYQYLSVKKAGRTRISEGRSNKLTNPRNKWNNLRLIRHWRAGTLKEEREKTKEEVCRKEVASAPSNLARSASGPGAAVVGCLVGVYPCSSSTRPRGPGAISHLLQSGQPTQAPGCRSCCCIHNSNNNNNNAQNSQPVLHNAHRSGLSLRVARVASITSVRAAPYTHPHHQPLTQECRCREETGGVTGGSAPILGSPMLFVPLAVPTFPATLQPAASRPAHQPHHQPLEQRGLSVPNSVQQQPARFNSQSHPNFGRQRTNSTTTSTADNQVNIDNSSPQSTLEHQKEQQHHQRAHPEDPQLLQVITPNKDMKVNWAASAGNQPKQDTSKGKPSKSKSKSWYLGDKD
ncbi:uncharacterized protein LOC141528405 [Cotesia typhae]|uniref:uncharacterized protein LOC141528405 n=1 Tax=Cotesia typhae TaxID=2053667 RepID=UPI003D694099